MNIAINGAITNIANKMLELYRNVLENKDINASRILSDSAEAIVEVNGTTLSVSFNLEEYWKYVEYGRRPGKRPPITSIEEWIVLKPIIPKPINGRIPSTEQLAYLISRKIGMEGTKSKRPLETAVYSDDMELLINELKNEIVSQLKVELGDVLVKENLI